MYRHLNVDRIIETLESLGKRIRERFPDSGLSRVCAELLAFAQESKDRVGRLQRANWPLRIALGVAIVAIVAALGAVAYFSRVPVKVDEIGITDLAQGIDAGINEMILLCVALFFLFSIEGRRKRRGALEALHQLRCIAHVIDMHQLTKDPDASFSPATPTASSPRRLLTRFDLARYLDYCSELLSLTSKLAALHVQHFNDPVVLDAVNDVETLAHGLAHKIWQKIQLLDTAALKEVSESAQQ